MDVSLFYQFLERYNFRVGVNNFADEKHATHRAVGYPWPGFMPGNGRTIL